MNGRSSSTAADRSPRPVPPAIVSAPSDAEAPGPPNEMFSTGSPLTSMLESARLLVVVGSVTALLLGAACFVWALVKSGAFVVMLVTANEDPALV